MFRFIEFMRIVINQLELYNMNMKKLLTLMLISVAVLTLSCKKEKETTITAKDLSGSWELRSSFGGMIAGGIPPNYSPGNGSILKFTETDYQEFSKGQLMKSGTYTLSKENFYSSDVLMYRIIYDGNVEAFKEYVEIVDGKLKVYDGMVSADGIEYVYQKIQDLNQNL